MISISLTQLDAWIAGKEDEHIEFKEAKNTYNLDKLMEYCVAFANERGGKLILGVTDKKPRRVVGSSAFQNLEQAREGIYAELHFRVETSELTYGDGKRVLIFNIPSRPVGMPMHYKGTYWMRVGEALVPMSPDQLRAIFAEAGPDYSAEVCSAAVLEDLNPDAIESFRRRIIRKSGNQSLTDTPQTQLLADAGLVVDGRVTYAALILFGTRTALRKHLPQAEIIFEYRSSDASGPAQDRVEYREGFFSFQDAIWEKIDARNDKQSFQDGLFVLNIANFNERAVRESLLNAVSHRDYRLGGSVFIRQHPRRIEFVSPGGWPAGIDQNNVLYRQLPRNRRIAEALSLCGLVERSGQGMNLIYENCIKEAKPLPDFSGTDAYQVSLLLRGEVGDTRFLTYLEKIGEQAQRLSTDDLLLLNTIHNERPVPAKLRGRLKGLTDKGLIEKRDHRHYMLSRRYYAFIGETGVYTRKRDLDKEANKSLLLNHITNSQNEGCRLSELIQVLPGRTERQVQRLLEDLKNDGKAHVEGFGVVSRWRATPT